MEHIYRRASFTYILLQHGHPLQWPCGMLVRHQTTLPVITVPRLIQQQMEKRKKSEEKAKATKRLEDIRRDSRKGNRNICIVRCRDQRLNHYHGQSYPKSADLPLASRGWHNNKSKGDHFTICGRPDQDPRNPAIQEGETGTPTFADLRIHPDIVANMQSMGLVTPTEIQRRAIPRLLAGRHAVLAAETGCGKTAAFLAPLLDELLRRRLAAPDEQRVPGRPAALVVTPGRELAQQIKDVADEMTRDLPLRCRLLLGGRTKKRMLNPQPTKMDLLVASFGALSKLNTVRILDLSEVSRVVLDEADTLLDDSFREDVSRLLARMFPLPEIGAPPGGPAERPPVALTLVGATLPRQLDGLLAGLVPAGSLAEITTRRLHRLLPHVEQTFLRLGPSQRPEALLRACREARDRREAVVVFSNSARTCDWVSLYLNDHNLDCLNVNGSMNYKLRQGRWHSFVSGAPGVLSCADVVSRGLDSVNVHRVINYEFPWNTSDYIHRAGRVGRQGGVASGTVTSYVSRPLEVEMAQRIEMAARTGEPLWNVDANIKQIIEKRMARKEAVASRKRS